MAQTETQEDILSIRKQVVFFLVIMTEHWSRLHRDAVELSFLETIKIHLDMIMDNQST